MLFTSLMQKIIFTYCRVVVQVDFLFHGFIVFNLMTMTPLTFYTYSVLKKKYIDITME